MTVHQSAHPEYLADPTWVQDHLLDSNIVVVDIDAEAGYLRGHIPGAVMLLDNYERDTETGLVHTFAPEKFAAACEALGIGDNTMVVVYDNNMSLSAARFWWVLNYNGHQNVKVLDGGWRRWAGEGLPVSFERAAPHRNAKFTPQIDRSLVVELDEIMLALDVSLRRSATVLCKPIVAGSPGLLRLGAQANKRLDPAQLVSHRIESFAAGFITDAKFRH